MSLAVLELTEYMVNAFTHLLSGAIMVVNLCLSDITGEDLLHLIWIDVCLDEIRGRLVEVFSLKSYKIDPVVHGAIA